MVVTLEELDLFGARANRRRQFRAS